MPEIIESFEWATGPEFKVVDAGKNTIRIKGVALKGDAISKNHRKYIVDELKRSARTWVGKPITINHDPKRIVGNLTWMEFSDESNALEYMGNINKQPYVNMLRDKSAEIRGVSVEAGYLHNVCPECKKRGVEKRFYTEEEFHSHMHTEHFIKTDPTREPHGILGTALSLVLAPEEPGYADTSIQLVETAQSGLSRLVEILIKTKKEEEKHLEDKLSGKAALSEETHIAIGKATPKQRPEIPESNLKPITPTQTVQKEPVITEKPTAVEAKPASPDLQKPMERTRIQLTVIPATLKEVKPPEPSPTAKEKLTLGEPFAGYTDFADCVAKNQEKDNPEAYCGSIKHETEGEMVYRKTVAERLTEEGHAIVLVNTNVKEIQAQVLKTTESVVEQTNKALDEVYVLMDKHSKEVRAIQESHKSTVETLTKKADLEPIMKDLAENKTAIANLPKDDLSWKEELPKKVDAESVTKELDETKALLAKKADAEPLIKELADTKAALAKTTENLAKLEETVATDRKNNETMLNAAKAVATENKRIQEEMTTEHTRKMAEKDKELTELKQKQTETDQKLQETAIRTDNLEDKQKGQFKGKNQPLGKPAASEHPVDPISGRK
jgi:hypothetical protein